MILRLPQGEYIEIHTPVSDKERAVMLAKEDYRPIELEPATDENGVRRPVSLAQRLRARFSRAYYGQQIAKPTPDELAEAEHHAAELQDGYLNQTVPARGRVTPTSTDPTSTECRAER